MIEFRPDSMRLLFAAVVILLLAPAVAADQGGNNVLLIVADDVGFDALDFYAPDNGFCSDGAGRCAEDTDCADGVTCLRDTAFTPTLDSLRDQGVLFRNAWATPLCSPTRATIQTGRYGFRTGVGRVVFNWSTASLPADEYLIPTFLDTAGVAHAAFGKWHLANCGTCPPELGCGDDCRNMHPTLHRIVYDPQHEPAYFPLDYYDLYKGHPGGALDDYRAWEKTEATPQGFEETLVTGDEWYATKVNVDDAVAWINQQTGTWFATISFNAAHTPFHEPPDSLLQSQATKDRLATVTRCDPKTQPWEDARACYLAMIEAMDHEIGRLLDEADIDLSETTILFVGDNGTTPKALPPDGPNHTVQFKNSLYEGGIRVPLLAVGASVVPDDCPAPPDPCPGTEALANTVDLFSTVLDLAGVNVQVNHEIDGVSLVPILDGTQASVRSFAYSELFRWQSPAKNRDAMTIRDQQYKLIDFFWDNSTMEDEIYDLENDRFETLPCYFRTECGTTPTGHCTQELCDAADGLESALTALRGETPPCPDKDPAEDSCNMCDKPDCTRDLGSCFPTDTGFDRCTTEDGNLFPADNPCPAGETIHVCSCRCQGTTCVGYREGKTSKQFDYRLMCMPAGTQSCIDIP